MSAAVIARARPQTRARGAKGACARARVREACGVRRPLLSQERAQRTVEYVIRARLRSMTNDCCSVTLSVSVATADAMWTTWPTRGGEVRYGLTRGAVRYMCEIWHPVLLPFVNAVDTRSTRRAASLPEPLTNDGLSLTSVTPTEHTSDHRPTKDTQACFH